MQNTAHVACVYFTDFDGESDLVLQLWNNAKLELSEGTTAKRRGFGFRHK